jgi:hypothetical protein
LGLPGCQGQFFGTILDQMDVWGNCRCVERCALSAAIAAREKRATALAVPESNSREAAGVDGIAVLALKFRRRHIDRHRASLLTTAPHV